MDLALSTQTFKQITRQYALFHIVFLSLGVLELVAFALFFSFFTQTTLFAFSLAGLFLTGFAYFVLFFYFQAKKPEELVALKEQFLSSCRHSLESHSAVVSALQQWLATLHRQEYTYYSVPATFTTLSPLMQKFSGSVHWKDLHHIKELILKQIVHEQIELVKLHPTDLSIHAQLAQTYETLAQLYSTPEEPLVWVSTEYASAPMLEHKRRFLLKALEEYTILSTYSPHDPWVYAQLAPLYGHLERPNEEIRCYETLLTLAPDHQEVMFQLGALYFEQGHRAQGLQLYERLKTLDSSQADELIRCY